MSARSNSGGFWEKHTDKVGIAGAILATLCCLGFPALVSILSAIGLGFLFNDVILKPLLAAFLLLTLVGLSLGMRHHRQPWALILGIVSAAMTFVFMYVVFNKALAGLGIAGLIAASLLNVWLRMRQLQQR